MSIQRTMIDGVEYVIIPAAEIPEVRISADYEPFMLVNASPGYHDRIAAAPRLGFPNRNATASKEYLAAMLDIARAEFLQNRSDWNFDDLPTWPVGTQRRHTHPHTGECES